MVPYRTKSATFARVLTITTADRTYELEADDPLQATQWHCAILAVIEPGEMGWWIKKAELVGKSQERYFELDPKLNEIRYFAKTGPDGRGKSLQGKINIRGETVVLPCDTTLHIINLTRSWELSSPTRDHNAVIKWGKAIQALVAKLRAGNDTASKTKPNQALHEHVQDHRLPDSAQVRPVSTSNVDLYTDEEWLEIEQHTEDDLDEKMNRQINEIENRLAALKKHTETEGVSGNYTIVNIVPLLYV